VSIQNVYSECEAGLPFECVVIQAYTAYFYERNHLSAGESFTFCHLMTENSPYLSLNRLRESSITPYSTKQKYI